MLHLQTISPTDQGLRVLFLHLQRYIILLVESTWTKWNLTFFAFLKLDLLSWKYRNWTCRVTINKQTQYCILHHQKAFSIHPNEIKFQYVNSWGLQKMTAEHLQGTDPHSMLVAIFSNRTVNDWQLSLSERASQYLHSSWMYRRGSGYLGN